MINHYRLLGVKDFASAEEIKVAYRKLSKKFHPDVNDGDEFFEEKFKEIQNAYEILCDNDRKARHDDALRKYAYPTSNYGDNFGETAKDKPEYDAVYERRKENERGGRFMKNMVRAFAMKKVWMRRKKNRSLLRFFGLLSALGSAIIIIGCIVVSLYEKHSNSNVDVSSSYENNRNTLTDQYPDVPVQDPVYKDPIVEKYDNQGTSEDIYDDQDRLTSGSQFSIGSTKDEVLQIQGNPTSVLNFDSMDKERWSYGLSSITFKNGRVKEYSNYGNNLKLRL